MANTRTIQISLDHLVAEMIAFPFAPPQGLEHGVCQLDPGLKNNTRDLWRSAERYFTSRFAHTSIDELISLRNLLWFHDHKGRPILQSIPLGDYLAHIAKTFLEPRGPSVTPKLPEALHGRGGLSSGEAPGPAARRAWRWLTFAIPGDLILAGLRSEQGNPVRVEIVSPAVAALLNDGFAETHLHFGIAFDFAMGWAAAVNLVGRSPGSQAGMEWDAFRSPGADHTEGQDVAGWLVRGAIVRYLLAAYLTWGQTSKATFRAFINEGHAGQPPLLQDYFDSRRDLAAFRWAIQDLFNGRFDKALLDGMGPKRVFLQLQAAYNRLARVSLRDYPSSLADVQSLDPLADFYAVQQHPGPSVQLQFLWDGLQYLEQHPEDLDFARLFWQVERVRCQVYRHCIQRPLTPGLTNFVRFYERKGALCRPIDDVVLESAGVLGGVGRGLHSLEVRTSPKRDRDAQRREIRNMQKLVQGLRDKDAASPWQKTECGLVLHFLKFRGSDADKGSPTAGDRNNFADPDFSKNTLGYRWQRFFLDRWREALAICNALQFEVQLHKRHLSQQPSLLQFLCGIDVCRDEPGVPTWVIAPLFKEVHKRVHAVRAEWQRYCGIDLPPLRTTAHTGEDFVHLATGIRFMDESLHFLPLTSGDRVGHGLALGVDPLEWARRATRLAMPREERWFDLIWERHWHSDPEANFGTARKAFVEDEILRLAHEIFDLPEETSHWTVQQAIDFVCHHLHDFEVLKQIGFPSRDLLATRPANEMHRHLERYLTSAKVYRRCRTVEWVEAGHDGPAVKELQRLVRQRFANLGITIEVNPISNLLVGDLSDLESHPLWRLAPGLDHAEKHTLRMCVGSDDPFPFATTLPEEYQFLYDSLVLAGKSQAEARAWLDMIRKMGLESRFTRPLN